MLSYEEDMRRVVPAVRLLVVGMQRCRSSFFLSVLGLKMDSRHPPDAWIRTKLERWTWWLASYGQRTR